MRLHAAVVAGACAAVLPLVAEGCSRQEPEADTYFDRAILPILQHSCARSPTSSGCHVSDARGNALGNLDVSSFEAVDRRRDLLAAYGPYGQPAMLVKVIPPQAITLTAPDGQAVTLTTDLRHAGGPVLDPGGSAYQTLRRWIAAGATRNNTGRPDPRRATRECVHTIPSAAGFDVTRDPSASGWETFKQRANPVLRASCAGGDCHGAAANPLYLTCGDTAEELRWNHFAASEYLAQTAEAAEILRRPLEPAQGGSFHEGGVFFTSRSDPGYEALEAWASEHGPVSGLSSDPAFDFFAHRVQPVLAKKGCMLLHCHSAAIFHDYRLRGGAAGTFSGAATRRNYDLSRAQLALESEDPTASRLVRKNLYRPELGGAGIAHRGGPLLEDFRDGPAVAARCAAGVDYDAGDLDKIPAYCVIAEWQRRERAARPLAPLRAIVYVRRTIPQGPDRLQDFDVYSPGAELRMLDVSAGLVPGADRSMNAACGLDRATADVRRPSVSWDGEKIAFAARSRADEPLRIYELKSDGSCAPHAEINAGPPQENGILVHNFDPAYSPPDGDRGVHLVFASTRGNLDGELTDYRGPQRTPADPSKPNSNLYSFEPDPGQAGKSRIRQLTFLSNMERGPAFMRDGRLIFTAEKRAPGFRQLTLRRINMDGGDYHPLYGQRATIGYREVTQVVQLSDKNFAAIFSEPGAAHSGGALGVFNRSIGVDMRSAVPADYAVDPGVLDPASPRAIDPAFFLRSLVFPDPSVSGRPKEPTTGLYTSPSPLPDGRILASHGAASDAASFGGDYDVVAVDPSTGQRTRLAGAAGEADIEAVAVYARPARGVYRSTASEPNAYAMDESRKDAELLFHDLPVIASLLLQNTPTGRHVEALRAVDVYESLPPPLDMAAFTPGDPFTVDDEFGKVYVRRRKLGTVPVFEDGSTKIRLPGGIPFFVGLPEPSDPALAARPRFIREEMMLSPGEKVHQGFPREFFNGFCGQCHGSVGGKALDVVMRPDVLAGASATKAYVSDAVDLYRPPAQRGPVSPPGAAR